MLLCLLILLMLFIYVCRRDSTMLLPASSLTLTENTIAKVPGQEF